MNELRSDSPCLIDCNLVPDKDPLSRIRDHGSPVTASGLADVRAQVQCHEDEV